MKRAPGLPAALQLEADQPAEAALEIGVGAPALLGVLVHAGIYDPRHLRMALQIARDRGGVAAMLAHAQRQGLQPLDELEGVEWAHRGAEIAQQHDAGSDDVGDRAERLDRLGPDRAVIAGVGLVQRREALRVRSQSKLPPSTMMPPIEVPWPPIYLVVE